MDNIDRLFLPLIMVACLAVVGVNLAAGEYLEGFLISMVGVFAYLGYFRHLGINSALFMMDIFFGILCWITVDFLWAAFFFGMAGIQWYKIKNKDKVETDG